MAGTSITVLSKSGKSGHLCFVPDIFFSNDRVFMFQTANSHTKPTAIVPHALSIQDWAEGDTGVGGRGWRFTADLCFKYGHRSSSG